MQKHHQQAPHHHHNPPYHHHQFYPDQPPTHHHLEARRPQTQDLLVVQPLPEHRPELGSSHSSSSTYFSPHQCRFKDSSSPTTKATNTIQQRQPTSKDMELSPPFVGTQDFSWQALRDQLSSKLSHKKRPTSRKKKFKLFASSDKRDSPEIMIHSGETVRIEVEQASPSSQDCFFARPTQFISERQSLEEIKASSEDSQASPAYRAPAESLTYFTPLNYVDAKHLPRYSPSPFVPMPAYPLMAKTPTAPVGGRLLFYENVPGSSQFSSKTPLDYSTSSVGNSSSLAYASSKSGSSSIQLPQKKAPFAARRHYLEMGTKAQQSLQEKAGRMLKSKIHFEPPQFYYNVENKGDREEKKNSERPQQQQRQAFADMVREKQQSPHWQETKKVPEEQKDSRSSAIFERVILENSLERHLTEQATPRLPQNGSQETSANEVDDSSTTPALSNPPSVATLSSGLVRPVSQVKLISDINRGMQGHALLAASNDAVKRSGIKISSRNGAPVSIKTYSAGSPRGRKIQPFSASLLKMNTAPIEEVDAPQELGDSSLSQHQEERKDSSFEGDAGHSLQSIAKSSEEAGVAREKEIAIPKVSKCTGGGGNSDEYTAQVIKEAIRMLENYDDEQIKRRCSFNVHKPPPPSCQSFSKQSRGSCSQKNFGKESRNPVEIQSLILSRSGSHGEAYVSNPSRNSEQKLGKKGDFQFYSSHGRTTLEKPVSSRSKLRVRGDLAKIKSEMTKRKTSQMTRAQFLRKFEAPAPVSLRNQKPSPDRKVQSLTPSMGSTVQRESGFFSKQPRASVDYFFASQFQAPYTTQERLTSPPEGTATFARQQERQNTIFSEKEEAWCEDGRKSQVKTEKTNMPAMSPGLRNKPSSRVKIEKKKGGLYEITSEEFLRPPRLSESQEPRVCTTNPVLLNESSILSGTGDRGLSASVLTRKGHRLQQLSKKNAAYRKMFQES